MGLDMYLDKEMYVSKYGDPELSIHLSKLKFGNVKGITIEAGYWRKANAIHQWFVENVQEGVDDCKRYYVSRDNLKKLLLAVTEVLDSIDKAEDLLPTQAGFFFGSTEYDDYYMQDLEYTKKILEEALKPENKKYDYYYHSSW